MVCFAAPKVQTLCFGGIATIEAVLRYKAVPLYGALI
jgi:hypothetical protein